MKMFNERFPMTYMEKTLKKYFFSNCEFNNKILTHDELSEYISWLIQTQKEKSSFPTDSLPDSAFVSGSNLLGLAEQIAADPKNKQALHTLADSFEIQREERYILANHDISIGRMFRYMPAHWHTNNYFEIYYCASGNCPIHFKEETITMTPGTVLIVSPSVLHASPCYQDDAVLLYYMVRSSTFDKVFWNQLPSENLMSSFFHQALEQDKHASYLQFETGVDNDIEYLLSRIYDEFCHPESYTIQMLNTLMSEFFILLLRRYEGTAKLPRSEDFYWKHEFSAILTYIQAHYNEMPLSEIAKHFNYSERQITRIVINCTGINYSKLVLGLRMNKAVNLLKQNILSVEMVSTAVGYSDLSSFCRAFTRYYGCTPTEYRNRELNSPQQNCGE